MDRVEPVARRVELAGTILEQSRHLQEFLNVESVILFDKANLKRPNVFKYPARALSEAMINMLVHRDYELVDPARLTSYRDRVEFVSPGTLPLGVKFEDLLERIVRPRWRNQALAWFFSRLQLAQAEGQGIQTIRASMQALGCPPPIFEVDEVTVVCVLRAHPDAESIARKIVAAQRRGGSRVLAGRKAGKKAAAARSAGKSAGMGRAARQKTAASQPNSQKKDDGTAKQGVPKRKR
jgi:ATP-dependent DNA helicase RecG